MPKNRCKIHIISSFITFATGMCLFERHGESIQKQRKHSERNIIH